MDRSLVGEPAPECLVPLQPETKDGVVDIR